jgi:hypothetical protein
VARDNRPTSDDRVLRRLQYAAAVVAIGALGLLLMAYVVAYATRDAAPAPDGPLVVVLLTAIFAFLGLKVPDIGFRGRDRTNDDG